MKERPISEITPPQGEAGGRERPNEDETRVRHEGENGRAQEGGAYQPQNAFEEHQERSGKENAAFFLCAAGMKKKRVCQRNIQTPQQVVGQLLFRRKVGTDTLVEPRSNDPLDKGHFQAGKLLEDVLPIKGESSCRDSG
ncbi:hypothetical protein TNCV_2575291 [Trichonephila clavipes]|uniref:Uncharacterized protein n=1 Tax=Trichonephila clavipes TaxID=2585209 RepID=A0A8X6RAB2_TRICX|nr:hypothetical protein TNCV_2575291 [Trichonephila clavipes]